MFEDICQMAPGLATRWATAENPTAEVGGACRNDDGRKRNPCIKGLQPGQSVTLLEVNHTSGTIRRIWCTLSDRSPVMLRGLRLEMTWDGAARPAVSVPLADFFCHSLGTLVPFENALFSSPEGRSFNCCIPMPFRSGARITVTNDTDGELDMLFYEVNFTVGDPHPVETLYFHAHWRRENPTRVEEDFQVLPQVTGRGRFLGVNFGVAADMKKYVRAWWGEGEVKIFLDGDTLNPTLCGTGTEDYIGTGWGQGAYAHLYQGSPLADEEHLRYGFYRFHLPDPVWFQREIRITIQQIGCCGMNTAQAPSTSALALDSS